MRVWRWENEIDGVFCVAIHAFPAIHAVPNSRSHCYSWNWLAILLSVQNSVTRSLRGNVTLTRLGVPPCRVLVDNLQLIISDQELVGFEIEVVSV